MSCCTLFNKSFIQDIDIKDLTIDIEKIRPFIDKFNPDKSGLWQPAIIKINNAQFDYASLLSQASGAIPGPIFDPCNCQNTFGGNNTYDDILDNTQQLSCSYCTDIVGSNTQSWAPSDTNGETASPAISISCCDGSCDVRTQKDDFVPKIPYLNQSLIKDFYDFKYIKEFPSVQNTALGFERFIISKNTETNSLTGAKVCVDWKIQESISEIEYDEITSTYDKKYDHEKAYIKNLKCSKTCGNFLLTKINRDYEDNIIATYPRLSGLIGQTDQAAISDNITGLLPPPTGFNKPYGFDSQTYNNIFIKNTKAGSYWKWQYQSGVLLWYRYFDVPEDDSVKDDRPIRGVDLYISPGDIFFAKNDGPEPGFDISSANNSSVVKSCPSGLKLIKDSNIYSIIPSGSEFLYISENIYEKFYTIYTKITAANILDQGTKTPYDRLVLSALLATAPAYDQITLDLFKRNPSHEYIINEYMQLSGFNKDMSTSSIGSVSKLNFIKNNESLINTLANKYGSYLWCPPNTETKVESKETIDDQCLIDVDFDMVIKKTDTVFTTASCSPTTDCTPNRSRKNFSYTQCISLGNSKIETLLDYSQRYDAKCVDGEMQDPYISALTAAIALNNKIIKEIPYSTGCYTLENIYPRITDSNTNTSCRECSSLSSYGLYTSKLGEAEVCCAGRGNSSFCDHLLAKKCDIADPLIYANDTDSTSLKRLRRTIIDGSLYLRRSYPVNAFNGRIDKAAFHSQGGVYFSSKIFNYDNFTIFAQDSASLGEGKPAVSFITKDAGIKIYNLEIQKLRSNNPDSYGCLGFPLADQPCKCMPINQISGYPYRCDSNRVFSNTPLLFTPNLSTSTGPKLKAYGGYSESELNKILGAHRIPNHPEPGTFLAILDRKIDPEYPYGCELVTGPGTILSNYTNTSWSLKLPNLDTEHSDIWIQSLESVSLNSKRHTTKITINDITLYSQQKKKFLNKGDSLTSSVVVNLKNPYLSKLLGETAGDSVLYPPIGSFCASNGTRYGGPGDELNTISLEFSRKPREQILNFVIANPLHNRYQNDHLILTKGFFHPNSGLQKTIDTDDPSYNKSPILYKSDTKNYFLNYEHEKFKTPHSDGYVFVGTIDENIKTILNKVNNFNYHKKLKLYLELNGRWYEYCGSNSYGFVQNDTLYPGSPTLFNYLDNEKQNNIIGPIIPAVPKKISKIPFLYNYGNRPLYSSTPDSYPLPLLNGTKDPKSSEDQTTRIPGVRPYFYVAEKDNVIVSQAASIASLSSEDQQQISEFRTDIILSNKDRYRYKGSGAKNDPKSYTLIDYNYLYTNFSDLNINYLSKSSLGYVYSTQKKCYQKVTIINKNNILQVYEAYIIEKKIYAIDVDKNGTVLSGLNRKTDSQRYIQIWTEFTFDRNIKYPEFYIDFTNLYIDINNITNGLDSIILLDKKHVLKKEKDIYLSNPEYQVKWYDLLGYDNILVNDITKLLNNKTIITQKYPQSIYDNFFYKTIINNTNFNQYNYIFEFDGSDEPIDIYYNGLVYYTIHQKYNINANTSLSMISGQHNYLPFMDINFVPVPGIEDNTNADLNKFRSNIAELSKQLYHKNDVNQERPRDNLLSGLSGYVYISGIYTNLDKNYNWPDPIINPNKESLYWLNIDESVKFRSALPFDNSKENFFSASLRIDDPFYQLYTVDETTRTSGEEDCNPNRIFRPYTNNSYSYIDNMFNFNAYDSTLKYGNIFESSPIYCDVDRLGACGSETCNIKTIGNISYSGQYIFFQEQELESSILQKIDNIKCILSYDAGNYNTILSTKTQPPYIQRFELDPDNPINPYGQQCNRSHFAVRPQRSGSYTFDTEYQDTLRNSIVDDHSQIVVDTDIMANEMLFRLLYGEKQKINLNRLDQDDSKPITYNDLFRSPNIQTKSIYKNIPYEYDITSDSANRKVSGSISIDGILAVGKNVNVSINGSNISINIVKENGKIIVRASAAGQAKEAVIYNEYIDSNNTIVTTEPRVFDSNGKLLQLLSACPGISNTTWGFVNGITSATLHNVPDCNGQLVDIDFPYWQTSADKGGGPHPCTACCPYPCRLPGDAFCGVCQGQVPGGHTPILFLNIYAGAKFSCYPADQTLCTNRDVGALVIPGEIVENRSYSLTVDGSKPNRGVMNGNCAVNGGVTNLRNGFEDPIRNFGNIESCLVLPIEMWEDGEQIDKTYTGSNKPFLKFTNLPLEAGYNLGSIKYFANSEYVIPDWRWNYISDPTYGPNPDIAYRPAICIGGNSNICFDNKAQEAVAEAKILPAWYRMALWGGYSRIVTQPVAIPNLITNPPSPCGDCYTLNSTDWAGNSRFDPVIGFPGQVCECRPYSYGYCQNISNAPFCLCNTLQQDYIEFDYNFEYCRYDFTLTGHRKKIIGHRENPEEQVDTSVSCNGSADPWAKIKNEWEVSVDLVEECVWYTNTYQGTDWYIHTAPTRIVNDPYDPGCPKNLCNITYDNNKTIVSIPGASPLCFNNTIRNNCPEITITLPDNSFTFTESIDSECGICGVDPTNIEMVEQTQPWETVTDTRTCVLGTLLVGQNKNFNGPVPIGGQQFTKCGVCSRCDPMSCGNDSYTNMGVGQCGQNAPASFPWSTCYSRDSGDVCTGGSVPYRKGGGWPFWTDGWDDVMSFISDMFFYSEIGITVWRDYGSDLPSTLPSIKGCDGQISMPLWTSNDNIRSAVISQWESQMRYNYSKIAACKAPEYNIEDVIEGVVGGCSDLMFKTISYPGITYRATLGDPQVEETTIDVKVAYYTYKYKRPKTIQDILLDTNVGPGTASKCSSINSQCPTTANINLIETFKIDNCTKTVTCYDTNTTSCRPNDFCCQYNK